MLSFGHAPPPSATASRGTFAPRWTQGWIQLCFQGSEGKKVSHGWAVGDTRSGAIGLPANYPMRSNWKVLCIKVRLWPINMIIVLTNLQDFELSRLRWKRSESKTTLANWRNDIQCIIGTMAQSNASTSQYPLA